jgi:hypothetical protein
MSYFFGVYPAKKEISRLFDLARLICQPDYARKAHITLRGPYEKKPTARSRWSRLKLSNAMLTRPSTFFEGTQNTVFLGVYFLEVESVSWKRDYEGGIPHMTIYDGNDRITAWQVLQCMKKFSWQLSIELTPILILEKKKDISSSFFLELDEIDLAFELISERSMKRDHLKSMHIGQRIFLLEKIFQKVHHLTHPSSTPK